MISSGSDQGQLGTTNSPYSLFYLFLWKDGLKAMQNPDGYENNYTQSGNTLSWYGANAYIQYNVTNDVYYWLGIG